MVYRKANLTSPTKSWHWEHVQQPPYADDPAYWDRRSPITSYGVVGGGSHVCISVQGEGTYCLDTASHTWSRVGEWTLPFRGKVEYVPELKLWLGFSAESGNLAAADLSSTMDTDSRQPQLVHSWKELNPPGDWNTPQNAQFVNLGVGRFCVARSFFGRGFDVLTGVEVVPRVRDGGTGSDGDGNAKLQMITHKSKWYSAGHKTIEDVF